MNPYVGIEVGVTSMYMYAQTEQGIMERTVPTGSACTFDSLKQHIRSFIEELPSEPAGVGIGLVGLVEGDQRVQFSDMDILNGVTADQFTDGKVPVRLLNGSCHCGNEALSK
ncbi:hypothetical protein [Paenibacillus sp. 1001270B_150601_E10]|uniref:hypothetical protein n=1 Tax=Paenibacillus sp. 1001270B_150601_E10 TaxID=2787079 RepID=UPI0018A11935|nr:hypothetical protein [Paenibacillus sp. 1001270B_150601_E10]